MTGAVGPFPLILVPPQLEELPQANVPARPAANAAVDARKIQFFIVPPYFALFVPDGTHVLPFCCVPGPHETAGVLLLLMFDPPQELELPQPIAQPAAAAKAIADKRKIFMRPPVCSE